MCTDLAEEGDERFAGGIHENKFIFRGRIWTVGVNSEGHFPGGIIHNEPIAAAGNEDGSLVNCEMGFFFKAKYLIHNWTSAAHLFSSHITATYKASVGFFRLPVIETPEGKKLDAETVTGFYLLCEEADHYCC